MSETDRKDLILVVDDSPDSLGMIHHALEQAGLTALLALDGGQALSIAEKMVPDLILLDAVMPQMDGFETCRQLKSRSPLAAIPVIFMTGLSEAEDVVRGLESGGVDYVTKPVRPSELIARIRVHLANARQTQSARSALDRFAQAAFSTDREGHWQWATPQAEEMIGADDDRRAQCQATLGHHIRDWLTHQPQPSDLHAVSDTDRPYRLRYLGEVTPGEFLFRIQQRDDDDEGAERLRAQLRLTPREAQVLLWIAKGKTNREIGQILTLSPRTVNKHLEQVFRKLGVENRTSAAAMALGCLGGT